MFHLVLDNLDETYLISQAKLIERQSQVEIIFDAKDKDEFLQSGKMQNFVLIFGQYFTKVISFVITSIKIDVDFLYFIRNMTNLVKLTLKYIGLTDESFDRLHLIDIVNSLPKMYELILQGNLLKSDRIYDELCILLRDHGELTKINILNNNFNVGNGIFDNIIHNDFIDIDDHDCIDCNNIFWTHVHDELTYEDCMRMTRFSRVFTLGRNHLNNNDIRYIVKTLQNGFYDKLQLLDVSGSIFTMDVLPDLLKLFEVLPNLRIIDIRNTYNSSRIPKQYVWSCDPRVLWVSKDHHEFTNTPLTEQQKQIIWVQQQELYFQIENAGMRLLNCYE